MYVTARGLRDTTLNGRSLHRLNDRQPEPLYLQVLCQVPSEGIKCAGEARVKLPGWGSGARKKKSLPLPSTYHPKSDPKVQCHRVVGICTTQTDAATGREVALRAPAEPGTP